MREKLRRSLKLNPIYDILDIVLPVLFVIIMVNFVVGLTTVESASMEPKLVTGTSAIFNRLAYKNHEVQRGDIVCIYSDELHEKINSCTKSYHFLK